MVDLEWVLVSPLPYPRENLNFSDSNLFKIDFVEQVTSTTKGLNCVFLKLRLIKKIFS